MSVLLSWVVVLGCAQAPVSQGLEPVHPPMPVAPFDEIARTADRTHAFVPSPLEMEHTLDAAGLRVSLADRVGTPPPTGRRPDRAALVTGVAIADLLLTARTASDDDLVARIEAVRAGMAALGAGADVDATLRDQVSRVRSHAVDRDELLDEFEELSQVGIPELTFHGRERAVPLIEAGSWLRGAQLLARALREAGAPDAPAASMLRAPTVVAFFRDELPTDDVGLHAALVELHRVAERPVLSDADLRVIVEVTGAVLARADG